MKPKVWTPFVFQIYQAHLTSQHLYDFPNILELKISCYDTSPLTWPIIVGTNLYNILINGNVIIYKDQYPFFFGGKNQ